MKSKRSCCNGPVLRKNLSRFAPAWLLYSLALLLGLVLLTDSGVEYWLSANLAQLTGFMGIVNFGYALLTALLLFGDLTQPRMCNALHALPLRRETWFVTHVLSGLFFSIIPTVIMTVPAVIASFYSVMENGWQIPLYWLLATNLEYLFFFGLAVLCMLLTGNRIGAAVIYCMANFAAILIYYIAEIIYVPHLPGVVAQIAPFLVYCPVVKMPQLNLVETKQHKDFLSYASDGSENYLLHGEFTLGSDWRYLWICAAIGLALLVLALLLYRKRKLECAGDLMATRKLEPVFLVLFSLAAAGLCQLTYVAFIGYEAYGSTPFLWAGLAVGWFTGLMLLRRSSRVFSGKSILGVAILAIALGASLLINAKDPFGIVTWTPRAEDVKSVTLHLSYMHSIHLEEQSDIEDVITLHALAAEARLGGELGAVNTPAELEDGDGTLIEIEYTMTDGSTAAREYLILIDSQAGDITRSFFSRTEAVFDHYYYYEERTITPEVLKEYLDTTKAIYFSSLTLSDEHLTEQRLCALYDAILADCEAGTLVQHIAFHNDPGFVLQTEEGPADWSSLSLNISCDPETLYLQIYSDSEHILAWLEDAGVMDTIEIQTYSG